MGLSNCTSPVAYQPFIWYAKYNNGDIFSEFDDDLNSYKFSDIDKENLKEFGLMGRNNKIYFNTDDGIFHVINILNNDGYDVELYIEDQTQNLFKISGDLSSQYTDIKTFKRICADISSESASAVNPTITEYLVGYNKQIKTDKGILFVKVIYNLLMGKDIRMEVSLSSDSFSMNGNIFIKKENKISSPLPFSLPKDNLKKITYSII